MTIDKNDHANASEVAKADEALLYALDAGAEGRILGLYEARLAAAKAAAEKADPSAAR